jgi:LEA14-like dessication related protein
MPDQKIKTKSSTMTRWLTTLLIYVRLYIRHAVLVSLLAVLTACATMQAGFEQPTVTVTSFRSVQSDNPGLHFEIGLRVVNPNPDAIKLRGIAYTISLEGRQLITGAGNDLPTIKGYSEGDISITAFASMFEAMRLFGDLMNEPKETLHYELNTKLDVGAMYPAIRVKDAGEISLRPPR